MTRAEYDANWDDYWTLIIEGKRVKHWMQDDGHNDILLEGERFYRPVKIV
jgi:hypothetical protein